MLGKHHRKLEMKLTEQREYALSILDTIFYHIRDAASEKGDTSFPNRIIIMDAMTIALEEIMKYAEQFNVDIEERDSVKLFSFTIFELNKVLDSLREDGFQMDAATPYLGCIRFLENVYSVNFNELPNIEHTTRILAELSASDNNRYASYAYLKGLHEACLCA